MRDLGEIEDRSIRAQVVIETARLRDWPQDLCAPVIASADDVPVLLAEVQELRESLKEREAVDPRVNIPLTPPDPPHRSSHYTIQKLESFADVRAVFTPGVQHDLNWVFASTSGIHGHYWTIEEILANWDAPEDEDNGSPVKDITVTILHPRTICVRYGTVEVTKEDLVFLSTHINQTILGVIRSQQGNLNAANFLEFPKI